VASALARYPRDCGVVQDREGPPRKYSAVVIGVVQCSSERGFDTGRAADATY
jgi:hypothetical protein